ncbi:hypothetical protein MTO96_024141 [Rhipicephalus appendiculatus]
MFALVRCIEDNTDKRQYIIPVADIEYFNPEDQDDFSNRTAYRAKWHEPDDNDDGTYTIQILRPTVKDMLEVMPRTRDSARMAKRLKRMLERADTEPQSVAVVTAPKIAVNNLAANTERYDASQSSAMRFHPADYAAFCLLTGLSFAFGLYYSVSRTGRKRSAAAHSEVQQEEVFLGGRSLPAWSLSVSLLASVATGVGVVSLSAHQYAYGMHFAWNIVSLAFTTPFIVYIFLPVLYRLRVTSVFQGGLRGVVWADCVQGIVLFAAPFVIIAKISYDSATLDKPLRSLSDFDSKDRLLNFEADASNDETVWAYVVATVPFHLVREGMDQMVAQRFLAARSIKSARRVVWAGNAMVAFFILTISLTSLALTYWYRDCDPMLTGAITRYDQVVPLYVAEKLAGVPCLRGLFLAGLVGASISTVSSVINSHAAAFYVDVVSPHIKAGREKSDVDDTLLRAEDVFFLYRLSSFWSSFIAMLATVALSLVLSLFLGNKEEISKSVPLSSPTFLRLWTRLRLLPYEMKNFLFTLPGT